MTFDTKTSVRNIFKNNDQVDRILCLIEIHVGTRSNVKAFHHFIYAQYMIINLFRRLIDCRRHFSATATHLFALNSVRLSVYPVYVHMRACNFIQFDWRISFPFMLCLWHSLDVFFSLCRFCFLSINISIEIVFSFQKMMIECEQFQLVLLKRNRKKRGIALIDGLLIIHFTVTDDKKLKKKKRNDTWLQKCAGEKKT